MSVCVWFVALRTPLFRSFFLAMAFFSFAMRCPLLHPKVWLFRRSWRAPAREHAAKHGRAPSMLPTALILPQRYISDGAGHALAGVDRATNTAATTTRSAAAIAAATSASSPEWRRPACSIQCPAQRAEPACSRTRACEPAPGWPKCHGPFCALRYELDAGSRAGSIRDTRFP
jgi:hypothetical protein